ncbi:serine hydrolase [Blautia sp. MSJ-19]|uniref:serine hydrolase n=1 Tax=Blautia sp. MSJ-19 TaxID=2841517 RepID=UPI001C0F3538|nr:serine hydrolase [Blautia sp. MSJ-19]MBU5479942.1 class A beta-lactamase-related serine hydrolase [Blautia sp. MSJ-19]
MATGNRLKKWKIWAIGVTAVLAGSAVPVPAASSSLLSVTEEAQIRPISDGSDKYLLKSDGFYCLKEDGSRDNAAAVHYFDHMEIDGTVLDGFYYHDENGCFQADSSHMVKINKLSCTKISGDSEEVTEFDGYYMVNNLGKLSAAPQVHYISNYTADGATYDGYYYFDENGRMVTEPGIHELEMTSNGQMFSGTYYFGGTNGVLVQEAGVTEDGFPVDETGKVGDLEDLGMDTLEPQLETMLSGYEGEWSVYVKDLETEEEIVLNDEPLYSASLIKAFVMAKTYEDMDKVLEHEAAQLKTAADDAKVKEKVDTLLWNMITVSDNESCNELGRLQSDSHDFQDGAEQVNKYLQKEGYTRTSYQSTLHPSASKLVTLGGHNQTTVTDCGKLLERIYRGECVSREASEEMLNLLMNQENTTKIPEGVGENITIANKTGETDEDQHDIAIVYGPKTTYILCVMSENGTDAVENIRRISRVVYNYLNL